MIVILIMICLTIPNIALFFPSGIAYDFPDSGGFGGNTTTSEACRKFYHSQELRDRLVKLCPPLYRTAFATILFNDLLILRLTSCRYNVLVDKIGEFTADLLLYLIITF